VSLNKLIVEKEMSTEHFCALLFQKIREDILIMKKYFVSCKSAIESRLLWQLQERQHFVENVDSFSLQDLIDVNSGELLRYLEKVQAMFIKHIKEDCEVSAGDTDFLLCLFCEISGSHGGEYDVQSCLLGYTAV
jgi:hypothetical protein